MRVRFYTIAALSAAMIASVGNPLP